MPLPSTISNCIIEGNAIDSGIFSADGTTTTTYTYPSLLFTTADCKIIGNNFNGVTSNSGTSVMVDIQNASCEITKNYFIRGSNNILAYVRNTGTYDQVIVDNIFDNPFVNNVNEELVTGLTVTSIYRGNKNQTGYLGLDKAPYVVFQQITPPILDPNQVTAVYGQISSSSYEATLLLAKSIKTTISGSNGLTLPQSTIRVITTGGFPSSGSLFVQSTSGGFQTVTYTGTTSEEFTGCSGGSGTIYDGFAVESTASNATVTAEFSTAIDLSDKLPIGVQILSVAVGLWLDTGFTNLNNGSTYDLNLTSTLPLTYSTTASNGANFTGVIDVKTTSSNGNTDGGVIQASNLSTQMTIGGGTGQTPVSSLAAATQYVYLDLFASTTVASGSNGQILATTSTTGVVSFPQSTINVVSTTNFPSSGTLVLSTDFNGYQFVTYTGTTPTSFTGCSGGTGTASIGSQVTLNQTINVASTAGFAGSQAYIQVVTTAGVQNVYYSSITPTSFTGCFGGVGTLSTGNSVTTNAGQYYVNDGLHKLEVFWEPISTANLNSSVVLFESPLMIRYRW